MIPYEDGSVPFIRCRHCERWTIYREINRCTRFIYKDEKLIPDLVEENYFTCCDCGGSSLICADFVPKRVCSDIYRRWTTFDEYYTQAKRYYDSRNIIGQTVRIYGGKDHMTYYILPYDRFVFGHLLDEDGVLNYQESLFSVPNTQAYLGPGKVRVLCKDGSQPFDVNRRAAELERKAKMAMKIATELGITTYHLNHGWQKWKENKAQ